MKLSPTTVAFIAACKEEGQTPSVHALQLIERTTRLGMKLEQIGYRNAQDGRDALQPEDFQRMTKRIADAGGENNRQCAQALAECLQIYYMRGYNRTE